MVWWLWEKLFGPSGFFKAVFAAENIGTSNNVGTDSNIGTGGGGPITLPNPLACGDIPCVVGKIINILFDISIPIVAIMVLIGGFQILTAGGNEEKFKLGRKTILYAAIGFGVILIANSVVTIIQNL